ncbi:aminotransferase class V-fold PLP-dependent enzyme [Actinospongicola halichondriae]|uniref:aminotransferase class V-fold PLP-dependent enzyme n=1 Tax=Actinospongicola halichondriae TaxID=3236844 RepID=UPI003D576289
MTTAPGEPTLTWAAAADADDPLRSHRAAFAIPDPDVCYLDGNSLGRPPVAASVAAETVLHDWSHDLVEAWESWIDRPLAVGDLLAPLLGAASGQVIVGESTTVSLHQAVAGALQASPSRRVMVALRDDFPTDRYVVTGLADQESIEIRWADSADTARVVGLIDDDVAVVVASAVQFETAAVADVAAITEAAHRVGALVVWDCSHAAGAIPLDLDDRGVDLAVGCGYKYLHGGPGSPAWTYVADRHHETIRPTIQGWFGQRDQFAMGPVHDPLPGPAGWRAGTPGILGLEVAAAGFSTVADAGIDALRAKSVALCEVIIRAHDAWFADLGIELASPRSNDDRGGHVALRHPEAATIVRAARLDKVVADFRAPDLVRLGPGPLATSYTELTSGLLRLRDVVAERKYEDLGPPASRVT